MLSVQWSHLDMGCKTDGVLPNSTTLCPCIRHPTACRHTEVGPHFSDRGYNAFDIAGVANFFMRDVTVLNADNALFLRWADRSTLTGEQACLLLPLLLAPSSA